MTSAGATPEVETSTLMHKAEGASGGEAEGNATVPGNAQAAGYQYEALGPQVPFRKWRKFGLAGAVAFSVLLAAVWALKPVRVCADTDSILGLAASTSARTAATEARATAIQKVMSKRSLAEARTTVQRALQRAAKKTKVDEKKLIRAQCSASVVRAVLGASRFGLAIDGTVKVCGNAENMAKKLGKRSPGFDKLCALNGLVLGYFTAGFGAVLVAAANDCGETGTKRFDYQCAFAIQSLIALLQEGIIGGWMASQACAGKLFGFEKMIAPSQKAVAKEDSQKPRSLLPANSSRSLGPVSPSAEGRRLFLGAGPANYLTSCIVDAAQFANKLFLFGLGITQMIEKYCNDKPPEFPVLTNMQKDMKFNLCFSFATLIIFRLSEMALMVLLALIHCVKGINAEVICGAGIDALINAVSGIFISAAGIQVTCVQGPELLKKLGPLDGLAARRLAGRMGTVGAEVIELAERYGFNSSDPTRLTATAAFKDPEEALRALEEFDRIMARGSDSEEMFDRIVARGEETLHSSEFERSSKALRNADANSSVLLGGLTQSPLDRELYVKVMESSLSPEARRQVDELTTPWATQLWQPRSEDQCFSGTDGKL